MNTTFNDRLRQLFLLFLIILLGYLLLAEMYIFLPGLLGGITLYILTRSLYFNCVYKHKWKKGGTALLFMLVSLLLISIPIYVSVALISPKINEIIHNQDKIIQGVKVFSAKVTELTGFNLITDANIRSLSLKVSSYLPKVLNSTLNVATNILMMFFLVYYLWVNGTAIERYLSKMIPLKRHNVISLATETKMMIRANAIGIPVICIVQGIFATLGYWLFNVNDWALWGFLTGIFAFFPLVGTMVIWVPMVLYLLSTGNSWMAIGLGIYSLFITCNVDYVARLSLLKKIGDVHPLVTILGVIVGLSLFGFMGLIFGPLLISYFIILVKIYLNEFANIETVEGELPKEVAKE